MCVEPTETLPVPGESRSPPGRRMVHWNAVLACKFLSAASFQLGSGNRGSVSDSGGE